MHKELGRDTGRTADPTDPRDVPDHMASPSSIKLGEEVGGMVLREWLLLVGDAQLFSLVLLLLLGIYFPPFFFFFAYLCTYFPIRSIKFDFPTQVTGTVYDQISLQQS